MSGRSKKSKRQTSPASAASTPLPASEAGPTPCSSPAGQQLDLFGQPPCPASPSARRAKGKVAPTKDTSGRCSFGSSASAALQHSLASRLHQTTDTDGSPEYEMRWKRRAMLSGAPICRLRASARPTSASGCSGSLSQRGTQPQGEALDEAAQPAPAIPPRPATAPLAGWPTPDAQGFGLSDSQWEERRESIKAKKMNGNGFGLTLGMAVQLVQNSEPSLRNADSGLAANEPGRGTTPSIAPEGSGATLAGWTTPQANEPDTQERPSRAATGRTTEYLGRQAQGVLAGWNTPTGNDAKQAQAQAQAASRNLSGQTSTLFPAGTERSGVLTPAHSLWLMGLPSSWLMAAPVKASRGRRSSGGSATPSSPK